MEHNQDQPTLIDTKDLTLRQLLESDNPALRESVLRLLEQIDDPNGVLSAFNSFIS